MKLTKDQKSTLFLFAAIAVMLLLFISSSQTYAEQSAVSWLEKILEKQPFLEQLKGIRFKYAGVEISIQNGGYFKFVEFFIRKGAHFISFFIIASALFLGLLPRLKSKGLTALISWLAATGYAGLDEAHQMLTGGRSPLFEDVLLDSGAALLAVLLLVLIKSWQERKKKK